MKIKISVSKEPVRLVVLMMPGGRALGKKVKALAAKPEGLTSLHTRGEGNLEVFSIEALKASRLLVDSSPSLSREEFLNPSFSLLWSQSGRIPPWEMPRLALNSEDELLHLSFFPTKAMTSSQGPLFPLAPK